MRILLDRLEAGGAGDDAPLLICGDPGIGKSRLLSELSRRANDLGWRPVWARSWDDLEAPPFWLWTQVARQVVGRAGTTLASVLSDEPDDVERFELFDATATAVQQASSHQPILVVLEDLHAADLPSLALTRFVTEQLSGHRAVVVASYRPLDASKRPELDQHLGALRASATEIVLDRLSRQEVTDLVGDAGTADEVFALTRGNPLFVDQVSRLIASGGTADAAAAGEPPSDTIRRAIGHRVDALTDPQRRALLGAAVMGRPIDHQQLAALLGPGPDDLTTVVESLGEAGLLQRSDGDLIDTVHSLVADAAISAATADEVSLLHAAAADQIGLDPDLAGERAHHLLRAGPRLRVEAVEACITAARRATDTAAEDAIEHYQRALAALADDPQPSTSTRHLRLSVLLSLGSVQRRTDHIAAADATFDEAWHLAADLDDPAGRALAALRGGVQYFFRHDLEGGHSGRVRAALDLLPHGDSPLRARLLAELAGLAPTGDVATTMATDAVAMARRVDDPVALGYALIAQQVADLSPATHARRAATAREIIALARRASDPGLAVQGRYLLYAALVEDGDLRGIDLGLGGADGQGGHLADRSHARLASWVGCTTALLDGDVDRANELAERYLAFAVEHDEPYGFRVYGAQLGAIRWLQGRMHELEPLYLDQHHANPDEAMWPAVLAHIAADTGRFDEAAAHLDSIGDPDEIPPGLHWAVTTTLAGEAAARVGHGTVAAYWEQLLPYADRFVPLNGGAAVWGPVGRPLGLLAVRRGRVDEGIRHLERARAVCDRFGARPWAAEVRLDLAAVLRDLGRDERADTLVEEARDLASAMDVPRLDDRLGHLARRENPVTTGDTAASPRGPWSVSVLGAFEVTADATTARWTSRKARELLKILVARRGAPVHREVLMDLLWPGADPATLGNRLSVALSTVRRAFDPERVHPVDAVIASDRGAVWLRLDQVDVDVEHFLDLAGRALQAHAEDHESAGALLAEAIDAHRGPALPDEPYAEWAAPLRSEVQFTHLRLLRAAAERALHAGDDLVAADALQRTLAVDPLDRGTHDELVQVLERMGASTLAAAERRRYERANLAS